MRLTLARKQRARHLAENVSVNRGPTNDEKPRHAGNPPASARVAPLDGHDGHDGQLDGARCRRKPLTPTNESRLVIAMAIAASVTLQRATLGRAKAAGEPGTQTASETVAVDASAPPSPATVSVSSVPAAAATATATTPTAMAPTAAAPAPTSADPPLVHEAAARAGAARPPRSDRRPTGVDKEARAFLELVTPVLARVMTASAEADWLAARDDTPEHSGARRGAAQALTGVLGAPALLTKTKSFLAREDDLSPVTARQLKVLLSLAADAPGILPEVVAERSSLEAEQAFLQEGPALCLLRTIDGHCRRPTRASEVDDILLKSRDLDLRARAWSATKDVGRSLKPGLARLPGLRNRIARELGFSSFWAMRTADYDVSPGELMALLDRTVEAVRPLYDDLHCWARAALASRYGRPTPKMLPAHWLANPWGQAWGELVQGHDLAPYFKGAAPTTLLESAERFYTSLGFPSLPASFWRASDPYPAPTQERRLKNDEPSAWHIDRDQDVRVLMNVTPNERWFETAHHELAHVYYFLSYARPGVPWLLRQGPNRSFHEAIAELARLASQQDPYLKRIGVLPANVRRPPMDTLLAQALEAVVPIPFSAGVMSHFERDLYENELPPEAWQQRWWDYVALYQGIEPPAPRETGLCDACTKPHLAQAPAQYYDFTLVTLTKFQLHEHICMKILHEDVHACDYGGHKEVGAFLRGLWAVGATRDWRELIEEATGEPLGAGALLRFFSPLAEELRRRNAGRSCQR